MKPSPSRRLLLEGLGVVLLSVGVGGHPRYAEAEAAAGRVFEPETGEMTDAEGSEPNPERGADTIPSVVPSPTLESPGGPFEGRPGAATALAVHDPVEALRLLDRVEEPEEGSGPWFVYGALRGRALRLTGDPENAVAVLEPRVTYRSLERHFPADVIELELARARVDWARRAASEAVDVADAQRTQAVRELKRLRKRSTVRNLAVVRVLEAETLASVDGQTPRGRTRAAGVAARALSRVVADYPNYPRVGELRLEYARALQRAGTTKKAADALRRIVIERAGELEAEQAAQDLARLAADDPKISGPTLNFAETLDAAMFARGLRRLDHSRQLLDGLLADDSLSPSRASLVRRSRSYTAYKQRDFTTCIDDLRLVYEARGDSDTRAWLLRCLERGERYDEALALWQSRVQSKKKGTRTAGLWDGLELAVRAGRYEQADAWLGEYARISRGHRSERAWLEPWLAYRLGRDDEAIEGFRTLATGRSRDRWRARYFLGQLLMARDESDPQAEGVATLVKLAADRPWGYYGLMARQRLLEADAVPPALPPLTPVAQEAQPSSRVETERHLHALDERFGEAWPPLRRARQLYEAGYIEEARREFRVAGYAYVGSTRGKQLSPRSEALIEGLGWKAQWEYPRAKPTKAGRKSLRDKEESAALRRGLWQSAHDLSEPYLFAKLATSDDGSSKARWHPRAYRASVEREARFRGIDPIHMWSLMYTESRFRRHVVSPVGARGALQIMPWTGRQLAARLEELPDDHRFDSDTLFDIDTNAHLAGYYVSELLDKFHGQAPMAYASYNGGPSNIARWLRAKSQHERPLRLDVFIEEIAFDESQRYARRVVEVFGAYSMLYRGELPRWTNDVDPNIEDNIAF